MREGTNESRSVRMIFLTWFVVPVLAATHVFAAFSPSSVKKETTGFGDIVPNRFIVEIAAPDDAVEQGLESREVSIRTTSRLALT